MEIFKTRPHLPTITRLEMINFNSILRLNEATFVYKNLHVAADSNLKKINFNLRNKVSQRIIMNGSDVYILDVHMDYRRTTLGLKAAGL